MSDQIALLVFKQKSLGKEFVEWHGYLNLFSTDGGRREVPIKIHNGFFGRQPIVEVAYVCGDFKIGCVLATLSFLTDNGVEIIGIGENIRHCWVKLPQSFNADQLIGAVKQVSRKNNWSRVGLLTVDLGKQFIYGPMTTLSLHRKVEAMSKPHSVQLMACPGTWIDDYEKYFCFLINQLDQHGIKVFNYPGRPAFNWSNYCVVVLPDCFEIDSLDGLLEDRYQKYV